MTEEIKGLTTTTTEPLTFRVKFYQLNVETWEDKGTGFCTYEFGLEGEPDQIIVHSEKDDSLLIASTVVKKRLYQRQQDSLIVWTEDDKRDLAISFQEIEGCEIIWKNIGKKIDLQENTGLPEVNTQNLNDILNLTAVKTLNEKDKISRFILGESYYEKIFKLFEDMEKENNVDNLNMLYKIMINILQLNDQNLIELLINNEHIYSVMGILEYKHSTPHQHHRDFIKKNEAVEPIIEFQDNIAYKLVETFRLNYLLTIVRQEAVQDNLIGILNNMVFQNHVEIVNFMANNQTFLNNLKQLEINTEKVKFIMSIFDLTKQMQNSIKLSLLKSLTNHGLFDVLYYSFKETKHIQPSLNLLYIFTDLDISTVRNQLLVHKGLIETVIQQFISDQHHELKVQYFELIKLLLDTNEFLQKSTPEMEEFLQLFYDSYAIMLIKPIESLKVQSISLKGSIEPLKLTQNQAQLIFYIIEFLLFSIKNHGFRSKYIILSTDLITKIQQLYRAKHEYIKLCALRFFRCCLGSSDEFYIQHLIKYDIFEATIRVLLDTNGKYSLLNSACLELFEFIRKESIKPIIFHIVNQFGQVLDTITYISTCSQLRLKYDQLKSEQEEIDSTKAINTLKPLVDYDSDDDSDDEDSTLKRKADTETSEPVVAKARKIASGEVKECVQ